MRVDTHRSEPRGKIVDIVVTQRPGLVAAFAAAICAELSGQVIGRLACKIRRVGLRAQTDCAVADCTGLPSPARQPRRRQLQRHSKATAMS
jgi:hypothetical protein